MNQKQILKKIEQIHDDLRNDQFHIMAEKIQQQPFHLHRSDRGFLLRTIIHLFRRKLKKEVELILKPVLDQQKDIHMRFLHEIHNLKKQVYDQDQYIRGLKHDKESNSSDSDQPERAR